MLGLLGLSLGLSQQGGGGGGGASLIPVGARTVIVGDSMTYGNGDTPNGFMQWLILESDGVFHYPETTSKGTASCLGGNMGVSGQTSTQYLARVANITAGAGSGALIIGGIENDFAAAIPVATSISNFDAIIAASTATKIFVTPVAPTRAIILGGHAAKKTTFDAYFAAHSDPRVVFLDQTWAGMELCTAGDLAGAHSYDKTHQNPFGAKAQAANMWAQMAPHYATGTAYTDTNLSGDLMGTSGQFAGTGGTAGGMGVVATSWTLTNTTGATVVASVSDNLIGDKRGQRLVLSGIATANSRIRLRRSVTHTFELGDKFIVVGRIVGTGVSNIRSIGVSAYFNNSKWLVDSYAGTQGPFSDAAPFDGVFKSYAFAATAGGSSVTVDLDIQPEIGVCGGTFDIADFMLFNLTDIGHTQ